MKRGFKKIKKKRCLYKSVIKVVDEGEGVVSRRELLSCQFLGVRILVNLGKSLCQ